MNAWETVINWVNQNVAELFSGGALAIIAVKTFISDKLNFLKNKEEYKALAETVVTNETQTTTQVEVIYEQNNLLKTKVETLENQLKIQNENIEKLINLQVQTLSVANVPLQAKETYFNALMETVKPSATVMESLKSGIDLQRLAQEAQAKVSNSIIDKLKNEG